MANEQRNREEKGGQDQERQAGKGSQQRDYDKNRREQKDRERGSGRPGRKT